MPRSARPSPRAERTRAAILEAAEALFAELGFAATRLEDVAARVGIRRASIVYYFRDKRALYDAVLEDVVSGLLESARAALSPPGPLPERIEAAVGAWVDYVGARPTFARLVLREVADAAPGRAPALLRQVEAFAEFARKLAAEARGDPRTPTGIDPLQMASTIAGATLFFVAAMPTLVADFDPLRPEQLEAHRREVLRITRRLLTRGSAAGEPPLSSGA